MIIFLGRRFSFLVLCLSLGCCGSALNQAAAEMRSDAPPIALPETPQVQPAATQPLPPPVARRYAGVIEPGQAARPFSAGDKVVFSFTEITRPITLLPSLYSASYEQLFNANPKYGHDAGAFGEKFGASMLRSASVRVFSDGLLAAAFHQDPRYYRIAHGSFIHRSLLSGRQAFVRRGDNGNNQMNYSGIGGRAAAAALTVTYYPAPSVTAKVVAFTFASSVATDAGGNLVLEFLPDIIRRVPILKRLGLE